MNAQKYSQFAWPGVLALFTGIYVYWQAQNQLISSRPSLPGKHDVPDPIPSPGAYTLYSRIWDDPLSTAYENWKQLPEELREKHLKSVIDQDEDKVNCPLSVPDCVLRLRNQAQAARAGREPAINRDNMRLRHRELVDGDQTLLCLAVFVPGEPYAEDKERRMRIRYAVEAGLAEAGNGLATLEETIPRQLERLSKGKIEALNFGVSGYCTLAEVELLRVKGLQFNPDVVVLLFNGTDYKNLNHLVGHYGPVRQRPAWVNGLFYNSALFRLAALRTNFLGFAYDSDIERWNSSAIGSDNVRQGIELLARLAEQNGFLTVIVGWPDFRDDRIDWVADFDLVPSPFVVEGIAKEHQVPVVWLAETFRNAWKAGGGRNPRVVFTIGDGMHASPIGAQVAAEALVDIVEALVDGDESTPLSFP